MSDTDILSVQFSEESSKSFGGYWSQDVMDSATPLPLLQAPRPDDDDPRQSPLATGSAQMFDSLSAGPLGATGWDPQPPAPATGSNTEVVPNRRIIPYSAVGKLYMVFGGKNYVGSAWTVANAGLFTAGHCVHDSNLGGWASNLLFVPQFNKGSQPLGEWSAIEISTLSGWIKNRDFRFDMASIKTDRPVQPATGSIGWMINYPANQGPYTGIGYPAAAPFPGDTMYRSTGNYIGGSNPIQMWGDMTGGCSGGPWVVWKNGAPYANGLNSFRYSNPAHLYSPYFGNEFKSLYDKVK